MKTSHKGFSLIELLITIAIVGILASVAIPSYNSYILQGHRSQALTYLIDLAAKQESYYHMSNGYGSLAELNAVGLAVEDDHSAIDGRYTLTITNSNNAFGLQLAALGGQTHDDGCAFLRINQDSLLNEENQGSDRFCFGS